MIILDNMGLGATVRQSDNGCGLGEVVQDDAFIGCFLNLIVSHFYHSLLRERPSDTLFDISSVTIGGSSSNKGNISLSLSM